MEEDYKKFIGKIITLEANIAVGKSTLGKSLCQFLERKGLSVFFFPEQIPKKLFKMYTKGPEDMKRYAFPFQVIVARDRKQTLKEAIRMAKKGKTVIIDRGLLGDYAFAYMQRQAGFFTDDEFEAYLEMVQLGDILDDPSLLTVFLDCTPVISFERMLERGDPEEIKAYDLPYFEKVYKSHRQVLHESTIMVDWNPPASVQGGILSDEACERFLQKIIRHLNEKETAT